MAAHVVVVVVGVVVVVVVEVVVVVVVPEISNLQHNCIVIAHFTAQNRTRERTVF